MYSYSYESMRRAAGRSGAREDRALELELHYLLRHVPAYTDDIRVQYTVYSLPYSGAHAVSIAILVLRVGLVG